MKVKYRNHSGKPGFVLEAETEDDREYLSLFVKHGEVNYIDIRTLSHTYKDGQATKLEIGYIDVEEIKEGWV